MRRHHQSADIPRSHARGISRCDKVGELDIPSGRRIGEFVQLDRPIGYVVSEELDKVVEDASCSVAARGTGDQDGGEEGARLGGQVVGQRERQGGFKERGFGIC